MLISLSVALSAFVIADVAVVDMSDVSRQPSLFYHLGVRESFDMANNVILYHDTDADTAQSLKVQFSFFPSYAEDIVVLIYELITLQPCGCTVFNIDLEQLGNCYIDNVCVILDVLNVDCVHLNVGHILKIAFI